MDRTPESILVKSYTDMASSLESTRDCTPISVSTSKAIPLLCTVCPEAPRFSDVSHLLTHIASKGHLHHETQTKLRAHQDIAASVTLQQYERWYKDNGIETLLVERMRAKQKKEAVKNSRTRDSILFAPSKLKRKARRSSQRSAVKSEEVDFTNDFSLFAGLSPSDDDVDLDEESINGCDTLSLKGQVWPGMGKMDLANEDMKRTRNQRKPNSVIEKMRRSSEKIEPTQVVMTSDFEVERIKGVYESSSPIPDQDAETPKRAARPKRKRPQALAEISVNVPRRGRKPSSRRNVATAKKTSSAPKENMNDDFLLSKVLTSSSIRHGHDVFRDDENRASELYGERLFTSSASHHEQRFDVGTRFGLRHYSCISHSPLVSPSPPAREGPSRLLPLRNTPRMRDQSSFCDTYTGSTNFAPSLSGSTFSVTDSPIYNYGSRFPFAPYSNVGVPGNDIFRFNPNHHLQQQAKQEAHPSPVHRDLLDGTSSPQFLHMSQSQSNPLFAQERTIFGSYHIPEPVQPLSGMNLDSLNQSVEHNQTQPNDQEVQCTPVDSIKMENTTDMIDGGIPGDCKHSGFADNEVWVHAETLDL
ncbi:hypothetical protein E4U43_006395 [Claviceps pusilla]|uniref:Uncharacterized protein n=1 Tax=Claviceps pusilla TaxID=123648 RepID=A0A9P7NFQ8_9HYPO|nr:hypothetical protein E4U43_006395 [Claviceps pusilla]